MFVLSAGFVEMPSSTFAFVALCDEADADAFGLDDEPEALASKRYAAGDIGRGESVARAASLLTEACEALIGEATSRKAGEETKGDAVSLRIANAATVDGVGEADGEGAPRLAGSQAMRCGRLQADQAAALVRCFNMLVVGLIDRPLQQEQHPGHAFRSSRSEC